MNIVKAELDINYSDRMFAFIDILGFRDLVEESLSDPSRIMRIYKLLDVARDMANVPKGIELTPLQKNFLNKRIVHVFSDTVTISLPYESFENINAIIAWMEYFQYLMWFKENSFVRGAIVYDKIIDEMDGKVFGPALNKAYDLERKLAIWPRIIIDESIIRLLPEEKKIRAFREFLTKDEDKNEIVYLDYLHDLFALAAADRGKRMEYLSDPIKIFRDHKFSICAEIQHIIKQSPIIQRKSEDKEKILKKYELLSQYHNSLLKKLHNILADLINNPNVVSEYNLQTIIVAYLCLIKKDLSREKIESLKPKYTAEKLEYVDIMPLLGIAGHNLAIDQKDLINDLANKPDELLDFENSRLPEYLSKLQNDLSDLKINFQEIVKDKKCR